MVQVHLQPAVMDKPILATIITNGFFEHRKIFLESWLGHGDICIFTTEKETADPSFPAEVIRILPSGDWIETVCQKAAVIKDVLARYPSRNVLLLDSDCFINKPIDIWDMDFDIALCESYNRKQACSGVVFVKPTEESLFFVDEWGRVQDHIVKMGVGLQKCCHAADEYSLDAIAKVHWNKVKVKWLPEPLYNIRLNARMYDKQIPLDGIIYHFAGQAHRFPYRDSLLSLIKGVSSDCIIADDY